MHTTLQINGKKAPSATELTRLLPQDWLWAHYKKHVRAHGWRGWQWCNAHSARAMRLGTHTHYLVEKELSHLPTEVCYMDEAKTIPEPERRMKLVRAWAKALVGTTTKDQITEIEKKVVNQELSEHGTIDAIAVEDDANRFFVKDWKTSGSISIDYPIQLAIYNRCLESLGYNMAGYGEIERVDKELKSQKAQASGEHHVQIKRFEHLDQYYPVIDALHVIWNYCYGGK
jgi:hypothetical protein